MAHRHIVAVCVVCLLCAEHLPCKEHISQNENNNNDIKINNNFLKLVQMGDVVGESLRSDSLIINSHHRNKRHLPDHTHPHYHRIEMPEVTRQHIEQIFRQFSGESKMDVHAFEEMIGQLKLNYLFNATAQQCMNEETFLSKLTHPKDDESDDHNHMTKNDHADHSDGEEHSHHHHDENIELSSENMMSICPILLYYILNRDTTSINNSCFNIEHFNAADPNDNYQLIEMEDRKSVWLYSTLSVVIVSLSGLCGVIVIPIMDKNYYHLILQFLVALAVGTMAGDALLHLLPHAMLPLTPDQDLHTSMMYRGLVMLGCIIFSYFFERFIAAIMECRQRKELRENKNKNKSQRVRVVKDLESKAGSDVKCMHKYSSHPECYEQLNKEGKDEEELMLNNHKDIESMPIHDTMKKVNGLSHDNSNDLDTNTLSTSVDDGSITTFTTLSKYEKQSGNPMSSSASTNMKNDDIKGEERIVILREHQSKHHGHSHTHGHVHSPPESLSAVAWMVILGDGLHNFTDGMAIGAAFSSSLAGGFSTALAVLCHELPHELGDFAVLLKAGMSPKKAICYNLLTAVLCVFGMIGGILAGNTPEASQYIFAGTAGLFIYIALVDMMPELTSSHRKEENCMLMQCSLQISGMVIGLMCMLFIAIYEHDLKEAFTS